MKCAYYPLIYANHKLPLNFSTEISKIANSLGKSLRNWTEIAKILENIVEEKWSDLIDLGAIIVAVLDSEEGFAVVKNLPFRNERPITDLLFLSLITCLGELTVHDDAEKLIWDVTPCPQKHGREKTFSELNVEAPLHTDSAFRLQPEEYFGLMVVKAAKIGGNSTILRVDKVIQSLEKSELGSECLDVLRYNDFPFYVPPAFTSTNKAEIIQVPIIGSPLIRFRIDSILSGFKYYPELATPQRLWAIKYFNKFIESSQDKLEMKLNDGDIIFVNNHSMLHGRTAFQDSDRLLLRVRARKKALS